MNECVVLLLRHGETALNTTDALRGRLEVPLNAQGRAQASALAARVAAAYQVDVLLTSPLRRAVETAAIVSAATGVAAHEDSSFIDIDYGRWAGIPLNAFLARDRGAVDRWQRDPSTPLPGAESAGDVQSRAFSGLSDVAGTAQCIAIVTHDAIIQLLICRFLGLPLIAYRGLAQHTASLNELRLSDGRWTVAQLNSAWHLTV
jgi:ribonuclease H / adenosylcobalamin/alpha-ribazole phosphatase